MRISDQAVPLEDQSNRARCRQGDCWMLQPQSFVQRQRPPLRVLLPGGDDQLLTALLGAMRAVLRAAALIDEPRLTLGLEALDPVIDRWTRDFVARGQLLLCVQ